MCHNAKQTASNLTCEEDKVVGAVLSVVTRASPTHAHLRLLQAYSIIH
jgi:hypothetical protein